MKTPIEAKSIILVGKFMEIENLFPYITSKDEKYLGVYIAGDDKGYIDYSYGVNWYEPHRDWNQLIEAIKKFDCIFEGNEDMYKTIKGLKLLGNYTDLCNQMDDLVTLYNIKPIFEHLVNCINWYNKNILKMK